MKEAALTQAESAEGVFEQVSSIQGLDSSNDADAQISG
jgi:hypothetical protein